MKRIIALLLCLVCLCTVCSCGRKYPEVESSESERRPVMTLTFDGQQYEVKYEVYRAFALMYRDSLEEGKTPSADTWRAQVDKQIYEIYATMALCESVGIDLYNKETDEQVDEYIRINIEGDQFFDGYGSFDNYLAALKEDYLTYAVADLLYRYSIGQQALYTYYEGADEYTAGAITVSDEDVEAFYADADTARVMLIQLSMETHTAQEAQLTRSTLLSKLAEGGEAAMADWLHRHTVTTEQVTNGEMVSPYTLDDLVYADVTEATLSLSVGEMSDVISVMGGDDSYYLVYRMEKTDDYFTKHRDDVRQACLTSKIGEQFLAAKSALAESRTDAPLLATLDIMTMSMDD